MTVQRRRPDEDLASWIATSLPRLVEVQSRTKAESVQLAVWLVGLSVGLIAVFITQGVDASGWLSHRTVAIATALATATVFFGVLHRVAVYFAEGMGQAHMANLHLRMDVIGSGVEPGPLPLLDHWDVEDIVRRLQDDFGLDYTFLIEYEAPIEKAREIYRDIYEQHEKHDREARERVVKILSAFTDMPADAERAMLAPPPASDLDTARAQMRRIKAFEVAATRTFYLAALSFVSLIATLAIGILSAP